MKKWKITFSDIREITIEAPTEEEAISIFLKIDENNIENTTFVDSDILDTEEVVE